MLKITFSGNLVADAEIRYSADGKAIINFRAAVNTQEQNADKEWVDVSYFYRVTTMPRSDNQREYIERNAIKGAKVLVSGTQKANAWVPRDGGDPRVSFEVAFPDVLEFPNKTTGQRSSDDEPEEKPARAATTAAKGNGSTRTPASRSTAKVEEAPDLEDLPF